MTHTSEELASSTSPGLAAGRPVESIELMSSGSLVKRETTAFLDSHPELLRGNADRLVDQLLNHVNEALSVYSLSVGKELKRNYAVRRELSPWQVAEVLCRRHILGRVSLVPAMNTGSRDFIELRMFMSEGEDAGLYVRAEDVLALEIEDMMPDASRMMREDVLLRVTKRSPVLYLDRDPSRIFVNNGIFDHARKVLGPFDPDVVSVRKIRVDYVEAPPLPKISMHDGKLWDVVSWVDSLSDDAGVRGLLWEVISAAVRPNVRFNQAVFFHSTVGRNGKGTLCELLRNLVGPSSAASIPLTTFGERFALTPLVHAVAVIVDENNVGDYLEEAGPLKAAVTGDPIQIDIKHKDPMSIVYSGLIVQCLNDSPKIKDRTDSFARRMLPIPFTKSFAGDDRRYIKQDFLARPEVLQFVLHRALQMDHTEFSNPEPCQALLEELRADNDPVREFWAEFEPRFTWTYLPVDFLYELFTRWFLRTHPSGKPGSQRAMTMQLQSLIAARGDNWTYTKRDAFKTAWRDERMGGPEPLIGQYDVENWKNSTYGGSDIGRESVPDWGRFPAQMAGFVKN